VPCVVFATVKTIGWMLPNWLSPHRIRWEWLWPFSTYKAIQATDFLLALNILKLADYDESRALQAIRATSGRYIAWQVAALEEHSRAKPWGEALALAGRRFPATHENALMAIFAKVPATYPIRLTGIVDDWIVKLTDSLNDTKEFTVFLAIAVAGFLQLLGSGLLIATSLP